MTTTLTITSGQTSFTAQGYTILPSPGTAVPDNLAQAILSAAVTAGVVLSSSAGTGVITVPSRRFNRSGVGPPVAGEGFWLLGDEIVDSAGTEYECSAPGNPGTWTTAQSGTFAPISGSANYRSKALIRRDMPGLAALPTLNPSPPTLTTGTAGAASVIASSILWAPDEPGSFTYFGGTWVRGTGFPNGNGVSNAGTYSSNTTLPPGAVEFLLDTADSTGRFEVYVKGNGVRVLTRNPLTGYWQYATVGLSFSNANDGSLYNNLVTLGAAGRYAVRLEFTPGAYFMGVRTTQDASVSATKAPREVWLAFGDSFTEPTINDSGTTFTWDGWANRLAYAMGVDMWTCAKGGTGYVNAGTAVKFRDRLAADAIAKNPVGIIWAGGINDSTTSLASEAAACWAQVAAALPNCKQYVVSPFTSNDVQNVGAAALAVHDTLQTAAATAGLPFLDVMLQPVVSTGSGTVQTGIAANASTVIVTAASWPLTQAGYIYLGVGTANAEVKKTGSVTNNGDGTFTIVFAVKPTLSHSAGDPVKFVGGSIITGGGQKGTGAGRSVSDGVTTATSGVVTSATAAFVAQDVGRGISGGSIPAGAKIASRSSATSVTIDSFPLTSVVSATGVTLTIGYNGNADRFRGPNDVTHPSADGHLNITQHVYPLLETALGV